MTFKLGFVESRYVKRYKLSEINNPKLSLRFPTEGTRQGEVSWVLPNIEFTAFFVFYY
jgi:hypothetical protein